MSSHSTLLRIGSFPATVTHIIIIIHNTLYSIIILCISLYVHVVIRGWGLGTRLTIVTLTLSTVTMSDQYLASLPDSTPKYRRGWGLEMRPSHTHPVHCDDGFLHGSHQLQCQPPSSSTHAHHQLCVEHGYTDRVEVELQVCDPAHWDTPTFWVHSQTRTGFRVHHLDRQN